MSKFTIDITQSILRIGVVFLVLYSLCGLCLAQDQPVMTIRAGQQELANLAVFSPDGTKLLTCGHNGILWDTSTGERVLTLPPHEWGGISAAAFSPDG